MGFRQRTLIKTNQAGLKIIFVSHLNDGDSQSPV